MNTDTSLPIVTKQRKPVTCSNCEKTGHYKTTCTSEPIANILTKKLNDWDTKIMPLLKNNMMADIISGQVVHVSWGDDYYWISFYKCKNDRKRVLRIRVATAYLYNLHCY